MVSKFFNYSVDDIKKSIITNDNWGSYFVIDNFLEKDLFSKLCTDFNFQKGNGSETLYKTNKSR